jgi:DNA-binding LacI/PurR family transcriptional regulator
LNKPQPLYQSIADYIADGIFTKRFNSARRLPSEMELARKFKTSRPTVVRAMIELQSRGLIERRAGSGTYVAPQTSGSRFPGQTLGLIATGLGGTEILDPISSEITRFSEEKGYTLFRGETTGADMDAPGFTLQQADRLAKRYIERGVSGVFFAPLERPSDRLSINRHIAGKLSAAGIAVVLLDREIEDFPRKSQYDLVGIDDFNAGYVLAEHLVKSGRRRIGFFAFPDYPSTTNLRYAGTIACFAGENLSTIGGSIMCGDPSDVGCVKDLIEGLAPDALICSNDRTAALLMQSLSKLNIAVPDAVAVAGFDDVRYATLLSVPLTSMRQPTRDIGLGAVGLMSERLSNMALSPRTLMFTATLIPRQSTAKTQSVVERSGFSPK